MSVSLSVILDTRRLKTKTEKFPLKLRVTFQREPRYYQTIYDLTKADYEKLSAPRISAELQEIRESIKIIKQNASSVADQLSEFSFESFELNFINDNPVFKQKTKRLPVVVAPSNAQEFDYTQFEKKFPLLNEIHPFSDSISILYLKYIKKLIVEGRISTAISYHCSYVSLKKFKGNIRIKNVTTTYLVQYEQWCKMQDMSKTTIGIHLRALRAIFNESIADKAIKQDAYPFGKRKYIIPSSRNIKKSLEIDEISKIYYAEPTCESEQKAKDYWFFCYLGNGMNPKDVAFLKYKNIEGEYLIFTRAKTEHTTRTDQKSITIYLSDDLKAIIERRGNTDKNPNNYIFPVLEHGLSPLRQYELVQLFISFINDWMRKICSRIGIEKKSTTIVTRHSFSTILKRSGASTEFIQEALGHTDKKTTENYLDSFQKEVKRDFAGKLVAFKNNLM